MVSGKIVIPTKDPAMPLVTLNSATTSFQSERQTLIDSGIGADEKAHGRGTVMLKLPLVIGPGDVIEGVIEIDIEDSATREAFQRHATEGYLSWLKISDATAS